MKSRFGGYDFSNVRIHADRKAATSAQSVNALAYTVGNDIVFSEGHYAPNTLQGRRLLAHELTHVIQQSGTEGSYADPHNEKRDLSPHLYPVSSATSPQLFGHMTIQPIRPMGIHQTAQTSIQRLPDFGLATGKNIGDYVGKVKEYESDKANQNKSVDELIRYTFDAVNNQLRAMGVPILKNWHWKRLPAVTYALFHPSSWSMDINSAGFENKKIGQLTKEQKTELAGTIYHESRHAEQNYKMAQLLAGQTSSNIQSEAGKKYEKTMTESKIFLELRIPEDIVKQAMANPLTTFEPWAEKIQVRMWYLDEKLSELVGDRNHKIHNALKTVIEEARKRRKGSWDIGKLQPAVDILKKDVLPQFDVHLRILFRRHVWAFWRNKRYKMVETLRNARDHLSEMIDLIQQQINSSKLKMTDSDFKLIESLAGSISIDLELALAGYTLIEVDAHAVDKKVKEALKGRK